MSDPDDIQYRLLHDPAYRAMIHTAQSQANYHNRAWQRGLTHGGDVDAARRELRLSFEGETDYPMQQHQELQAAAAQWNHGTGSLYAALFDPL